jgi:hypothetical protein
MTGRWMFQTWKRPKDFPSSPFDGRWKTEDQGVMKTSGGHSQRRKMEDGRRKIRESDVSKSSGHWKVNG